MNAIFTISANNYAALALTLCDSIRATGGGADRFVFLADEPPLGGLPEKSGVAIVPAREIGIPQFADMAFKYDVVEFSTSIKPFCIEHLLTKGYDKILYVDPDMAFFRPVADVFAQLEGKDALVTPHVLDLAQDEAGAMEPGRFLVSGVFNMGFFGLRRTPAALAFLEWWKHKLSYACYADRHDGLFTDQKWMEFAPIYLGGGLRILRDPGLNVAWWNLHERTIGRKDGAYAVRHRGIETPLALMHFSGYDPMRTDVANRRIEKNEGLRLVAGSPLGDLFGDYRAAVLANGHEAFRAIPYAYDRFENGDRIAKLHRRLYRRLTDRRTVYRYEDEYQRETREAIVRAGREYPNPFSCAPGGYWDFLRRNGLLDSRKGGTAADRVNVDAHSQAFLRKTRALANLMRLAKRVLGLNRYLMLMRFLEKYARDEMQVLLVRDL
jgi:hypothetical protein